MLSQVLVQLEKICRQYIIEELNAIPATFGHHGLSACICTSANQVICHGISNENKILKEGDILNIDVTVKKDGFIGGTSKMFLVGQENSSLNNFVLLPVNVCMQELKLYVLALILVILITQCSIMLTNMVIVLCMNMVITALVRLCGKIHIS